MAVDPMISLGSGVHVFFTLLILAICGYLIAELRKREPDYGTVYNLAVATAVLLWIAWITAGWYYVLYYGTDKAVIKAGTMNWAHNVFMEVKEHIFYTGLLLGTLLPMAVAAMRERIVKGQGRLIVHTVVALILGDLLLDLMGGAISIAAKYSWMVKAGG